MMTNTERRTYNLANEENSSKRMTTILDCMREPLRKLWRIVDALEETGQTALSQKLAVIAQELSHDHEEADKCIGDIIMDGFQASQESSSNMLRAALAVATHIVPRLKEETL